MPPYEVDECAASLYLLLPMMATPSEELARRWAEHSRLGDDDEALLLASKLLAKRTDEAARRWKGAGPAGVTAR